MKYIGITGKRGSGRETFAWLLGKTLQCKDDITFEEYQKKFKDWTDNVKQTKVGVIGSTNFFVLESFGGIILDSIKFMIPALYPLDLSQESSDLKLCFDTDTLRISDDGDTTVGEFIIKYADKVIKKSFGQKFWVNIAEQWADQREEDTLRTEKYTIYWDVKTDAEIEYVKRKGGVMINLSCPERLRIGGYNTIQTADGQVDYNIRLHKDFVNDCQQIWNLSHEL
jgi:hypothetical protein